MYEIIYGQRLEDIKEKMNELEKKEGKIKIVATKFDETIQVIVEILGNEIVKETKKK